MKLLGTRIRVEKSEHKTEYFPEYCLEEKTWFGLGKPKQCWYGVSQYSSHKFGDARKEADSCQHLQRYSLAWAKAVICYQTHYWAEYIKEQEHLENREITYVKYP